MVLGLSDESAQIVIERIEELQNEASELRRRMQVINCDMTAIRDEYLARQPEGIVMVIRNARSLSSPNAQLSNDPPKSTP
jgi:hypothetical protein